MTEKRFNVFDVDGTVFLEDHKEGSYHIGEIENVDVNCLNDIADRLNTYAEENEQLKEEIARQKYTKHIMRGNIKSYEREIKRLRKSYEKFDEMRLERIRFLEKRLKKNGLSIYVNGCGDFE